MLCPSVKAQDSTKIGTDSIMHLRLANVVLLTIVVAVAAVVVAAEVEDLIGNNEGSTPSVKLDKNLRRALLKALADLEEESAEHPKNNEGEDNIEETTSAASSVVTSTEVAKNDLNNNFSKIGKTSFSFNGFLGEREFPNEEKLQNSSFVEIDKYTFSSPTTNDVRTTHQELKEASQVHDLVTAEKSSALYLKDPLLVNDDVSKDYQEIRSIKNAAASVNSVQSVSSKPITQLSVESLSRSASSNIAALGNSLIPPKPTASSLTAKSKSKNASVSISSTNADVSEEKTKNNQEVKIFQAPLVAAFTVQQDERGVPKSVVPIYKSNGDGQALSLQEQLEFKQQQLEKQLADLQRQQLQQTQFLARQQQLYEEQLRFKQQQQQQIYLREQARLKQLEEQRIYQHQIQQQQQQQRLQQATFDQNTLLTLQSPFDKSIVQFEPSVSLQVPSAANPQLFQSNHQEQLRLQQLQQQLQFQQQQQQQQQQQRQQQQQQQQLIQQQQQQRLQQSFGALPATEFQSPVIAAARFNRQEVFGSTGNFGFNDNGNTNFNARGNFGGSQFNAPSRNRQNFGFDGFNQYRQTRPQTPARQIQHLLYQSGVASHLGSARGSGGAEDLNIVSKVLALNVGAIPSNNLQFAASQRVSSFAKPPKAA